MYKRVVFIMLSFLLLTTLASCTIPQQREPRQPVQIPEDAKVATFAGGCFWCIESAFQDTPGVVDAVSGYMGGQQSTATYDKVSLGKTEHKEVVQVYYDQNQVTYDELLDRFWSYIDPTDAGGQFADRGTQYQTAIFYHDGEQKSAAEKSIASLEQSGQYDKPIVTELLPATQFYKAEEYHQDYYKKKFDHYERYYAGSGRKEYVENKKEEQLKEKLTDEQYAVTQEGKTEKPFDNEYWDHKEEGIYVDIVTGEPLFSSTDKYDSGSGWPSFTKPITQNNIFTKPDNTYGMQRTEVKSSGDSHLGHVFDDGPNGSDRFCINSASLRFVAKEDLEKEGYGEFLYLFE